MSLTVKSKAYSMEEKFDILVYSPGMFFDRYNLLSNLNIIPSPQKLMNTSCLEELASTFVWGNSGIYPRHYKLTKDENIVANSLI